MTTENKGIMDAIADFQSDMGISESDSAPESVNEQPVEEVAEVEAENLDEGELESEVAAEDSEAVDEEEPAEEAEPELPSVEYVKADGKKVKIDYNDRDHIKRVYQKYVAQTRYQSERDAARKELADFKEASSKDREVIELLNSNIDDPEEMYRLFTGGKSLRDQFKEWQQEEDKVHLMSAAEKKAYFSAKEVEKRQKELEKKEAALQRKLAESEEKETAANRANQQALVNSSFEKYRFNEIDDPVRAQQLDERLWNDAKMKLLKYDSINKEIIEKEMKETAEALRSLIGGFQKKEQKKAVAQKKTAAKKAAAKAVAEPKTNNDPMVGGLAEMLGIKL